MLLFKFEEACYQFQFVFEYNQKSNMDKTEESQTPKTEYVDLIPVILLETVGYEQRLCLRLSFFFTKNQFYYDYKVAQIVTDTIFLQ